MTTEQQKMLAGELYDPLDPALVAARTRSRDLCQALNATREADQDERRRLLCALFGAGGDTVWMQPPFFCDYGSNIALGEARKGEGSGAKIPLTPSSSLNFWRCPLPQGAPKGRGRSDDHRVRDGAAIFICDTPNAPRRLHGSNLTPLAPAR
jgi:hypothetical protein